MPRISSAAVREFLGKCESAETNYVKGRALEDLFCYLFELVPGITVSRRNTLSTFHDEEVDVAFWNDKSIDGFPFLPYIILVECKNWSTPVGSDEVSWFINKLANRGLMFGILVATNNITGSAESRREAHQTIARALADGRQLIVIDRQTIEKFKHTDELVLCVKEKLCDLAVAGTALP